MNKKNFRKQVSFLYLCCREGVAEQFSRLFNEAFREIDKLEEENKKLYSLINRMQKYFAPTNGEWRFVEEMLEKIKEQEK